MKNMIQIAAIMLIAAGGLVSCTYYPRLTGIPLIKEKGDTMIEGGITVVVPNIYMSASYGMSDKISIQTAVSANSYNCYLHGAAGLYKKVRQDRNVIELYCGFGYGAGNQNTAVTSVYQSGNYQVYFAQFNYGNIGKKVGNFESGFGIKLGYLHTNMNVTAEFYSGLEHQRGLFIEPTGFFRFGGPKWKFNAAFAYGKWFQISDNTEIYTFPINIGIGVTYNLNILNNKSNNKF
jgi:hypothetical protein